MDTVYAQLASGWTERRESGGANNVRAYATSGRVLCVDCFERLPIPMSKAPLYCTRCAASQRVPAKWRSIADGWLRLYGKGTEHSNKSGTNAPHKVTFGREAMCEPHFLIALEGEQLSLDL